MVKGAIYGVLILLGLYVGLSHADGVATIFKSGGPQVIGAFKVLQGR